TVPTHDIQEDHLMNTDPAHLPDPPPPTPIPPEPDPLASTRGVTLADVAPGRELHGIPVRTVDGRIVVVLDWAEHDPAQVRVWSDRGGAGDMAASTRATTITDPRLAAGALRCALATQIEAFRDLYGHLGYVMGTHERVLGEIRDYAIDRFLDGTISRQGLDHFLAHFHFDPYVTRYRVTYTITGRYDVEDTDTRLDTDTVRLDAEDNLIVDLNTVAGVVDRSDDYTVEATAEPAPTDGS
ncbi:MAG TPA: hypothetical protein VI248_19295, partial [Kineosporiaceae bacterium]